MSVRRDASDRVHPKFGGIVHRLVEAGKCLVAGNSEGMIVLSIVVAFVVVWMLFWTVSTASVDVHIDADEAIVWARHFAFGYKHPPVTGWLFALWFSVFPRQPWAVDLLNVTMLAVAVAVTWRLLRDHLDKNRALLGLLALLLIPLYDVKAEVLNANTVTIPFWAATLLFYLRARRGLGSFDAFFAGAFASLTMLGKYWAVFLLAGMAVASLVGPGARRFWRSPAPYVMAAGAAIVIAPHVWWLVSERGGASVQFAESVANHASFGDALTLSAYYILGAAAYIAGPLIFLAALRPSRAALADIAWPADEDRRQALVLLLVPLVLPALVNLVIPYRLTPDWTFPNWALLPVVLYASRYLIVDEAAVARAGLVVVAGTVVALVASPVIACRQAHERPRPVSAAFSASRGTGGSVSPANRSGCTGALQQSPRGCHSICRKRGQYPPIHHRPRGAPRAVSMGFWSSAWWGTRRVRTPAMRWRRPERARPPSGSRAASWDFPVRL